MCTYFPEHFVPKETSEINAHFIEIIKRAQVEDTAFNNIMNHSLTWIVHSWTFPNSAARFKVNIFKTSVTLHCLPLLPLFCVLTHRCTTQREESLYSHLLSSAVEIMGMPHNSHSVTREQLLLYSLTHLVSFFICLCFLCLR